ncbi:Fe3+/spermidine/putrescine ABC transporter ATP-binding protein [Bordetella genomosp. 9]|uniref:Fe3+/spermidine/putrescine ABC transporter ATP-binding protein n=1 Tax=Bordetella genomosp. 9 TaxID=1416803 RepID=A0A261R5U3_9BORD|nr:ABC transporter ATP-binding protein [Bordetella genomosp. 9]OZI20321.1 Fe3+/spermidine/putrescine ABC transporter ATP-binding protein [Bordetella genomosp. 9]
MTTAVLATGPAAAAPARDEVLSVRDVDIRYGHATIVSDATFTVHRGEFITLLGPSGSGKTSLLRTIAGFVPASRGEIRLQGESMKDVPPYRRDVGLVFQNYALFPHMTVAENLAFGPRMTRVSAGEIEARIQESLSHVRLSQYAARYPHELSGGQQQRVAIARALAMRPSLLLLDEPMSNLDARLRAEMRVELTALLKKLCVTAVSVTHSQDEALAMSDRVIVMAEGGIRQIGTPGEIYLHPVDQFVAGFVGAANIVPAEYVGVRDGLPVFKTCWGQAIPVRAGAAEIERAALLLIRPESICVLRAAALPGDGEPVSHVTGRIVHRCYMGSHLELRVDVGACELMARQPVGADVEEFPLGERVVLQWPCHAVQVVRP